MKTYNQIIFWFDFYTVKMVENLAHENNVGAHYGEFASRKVEINTLSFMRHRYYVEVVYLL